MSGEPWFGVWRASSLHGHATPFSGSYRVTIRSLNHRAKLLHLSRFRRQQLGTCKHIERCSIKSRRAKIINKFRTMRPRPLRLPGPHGDSGARLRLHRSQDQADDLRFLLDDYFDADGAFRGGCRRTSFPFRRRPGNGATSISARMRRILHGIWPKKRLIGSGPARSGQITNSRGKLPGVNARLYPYQVEGTTFLAGTGRALLADDMGLGKTLQAIGAAVWLRENEGRGRSSSSAPPPSSTSGRGRSRNYRPGSPDHPRRAAGTGVQYRARYRLSHHQLRTGPARPVADQRYPAADLIIMDERNGSRTGARSIAAAVKRIPSAYVFVLSRYPAGEPAGDLYSLCRC